MKILIPNATGPTNMGDQAILLPLLAILKKEFLYSEIVIHSSEPKLYKKDFLYSVKHTIYSWTMFEERDFFARLTRSFLLLLAFCRELIGIYVPGNKYLANLFDDYRSADLIVFVGGGYFRSQKAFTQSLNIIFLSIHFLIAWLFHKKIIVAPISFGPFAFKWQEKYIAWVLGFTSIVLAREIFSFELLKKNKVKNVLQALDTALLFECNLTQRKNKKLIIGFTVRNWFELISQSTFEKLIAEVLSKFSYAHHCEIQPIIQVDNNVYGDNDYDVTQKVISHLETLRIKTLPIKKVTDLEKSASIYGEIDMLLGMRMHSNILAALYTTPFVALSYEYKTEGIAKDLGVEEYCIKVEDVTENKLFCLLEKAYQNRNTIKEKLKISLEEIRNRERKKWNEILSRYQ